ncbi:MAG: sulfatase [Aristaeellaceae bacterium]
MNLIYLHTHDTGRCCQPYGYPVATPALQALAEQSLLFANAHCCAPTCSPSRAALLTGMAPHSCGMLGLAHRGFGLKDTSRHLAAWLGAHGFDTVLCGVQHEARRADLLPYGRIIPCDEAIAPKREPVAYDADNCRRVCRFLRESHPAPFFLSFGLRNTHRPYPPHEGSADYTAPFRGVPNTPEARQDAADFARAIRAVDQCVGEVLDTLRETGLTEDTVLLFTTDHGPAFPHHKCTLRDGGTGVAMMLAFPGNRRAGQVTDQLVSQLDVFPTLCELLGVERPAWLQGVSLMPLLQEDQPVREALFAEVTYHAAYEPMRSVRTRDYKLIRRYDAHNTVVAANIDASPSKQLLCGAGLLRQATPREELYDLRLDPEERDNRVNDPALRAVYAELNRLLYAWMRDTDDPLLIHMPRVPRPEGARVNALTALEPDEDAWEP